MQDLLQRRRLFNASFAREKKIIERKLCYREKEIFERKLCYREKEIIERKLC